jgi:hypothetical protein
MNERLKELAAISGFDIDTDGKFSSFAEKTRLDCFASLIVKECGQLLIDIMLHGDGAPESGYDILLKHFGVET